ncbi:gliding motility-associated C-terminal domain-containing protein [Flavobacterium sp. DG2-3]|uniref:gliding motility-associated C-terminal domain-containing protein n=1 Tax=Flavobacterium sp. DG2-3 TaxID=3068317 RepID=UPI00273E8C84|nr:gliding motility-associated C-terminal domain-containing protein [Flavobacterium sp. DG2-3]MDP5199135.1 gliding motility-associated C-terminal domain-containing protein [Flavobacterium sp. DG2-3]
MKNQSFYNKEMLKTGLFCLFCAGTLQAQIVNKTTLKVKPGTIVSLGSDFNNTPLGEVINDGQLEVKQHWSNDGKISFTESEQGTTHFIGGQEQIIDGDVVSQNVYTRFKNVVFDNKSETVPFILAREISISGNADFKNGIVDADTYDSTVTFDKNSSHKNAGKNSFIDGKLKKIGTKEFEFPSGDKNYYRPMLHGAVSEDAAYVVHYFLENSDLQFPHNQKQDQIKLIDNKEYWKVTKENKEDKIVLSLTLDPATTASYIYDALAGTSIQIVRWDIPTQQWKAEGGIVDAEQKMVTGRVSKTGIFTVARVTARPGELEDGLIVYNAVSPNGDGMNDFFKIEGINNFPDNTLEIYNRYGIKVYQANGYNEQERVFRGEGNGKGSFKQGAVVPTGTYFYILRFKNGTGYREKAGYLYLSQDN